MIIKDYKCKDCGKIEEITIKTDDITGNKGLVNDTALLSRIRNPRQCKCGGELRQVFSALSPMFFDNRQKGKITSRFA